MLALDLGMRPLGPGAGGGWPAPAGSSSVGATSLHPPPAPPLLLPLPYFPTSLLPYFLPLPLPLPLPQPQGSSPYPFLRTSFPCALSIRRNVNDAIKPRAP